MSSKYTNYDIAPLSNTWPLKLKPQLTESWLCSTMINLNCGRAHELWKIDSKQTKWIEIHWSLKDKNIWLAWSEHSCFLRGPLKWCGFFFKMIDPWAKKVVERRNNINYILFLNMLRHSSPLNKHLKHSA